MTSSQSCISSLRTTTITGTLQSASTPSIALPPLTTETGTNSAATEGAATFDFVGAQTLTFWESSCSATIDKVPPPFPSMSATTVSSSLTPGSALGSGPLSASLASTSAPTQATAVSSNGVRRVSGPILWCIIAVVIIRASS